MGGAPAGPRRRVSLPGLAGAGLSCGDSAGGPRGAAETRGSPASAAPRGQRGARAAGAPSRLPPAHQQATTAARPGHGWRTGGLATCRTGPCWPGAHPALTAPGACRWRAPWAEVWGAASAMRQGCRVRARGATRPRARGGAAAHRRPAVGRATPTSGVPGAAGAAWGGACHRASAACAGLRACGAGRRCRPRVSAERLLRAGTTGKPSGLRRPTTPCAASGITALARSLTPSRTPGPRPGRRAATTAFHGAEGRSSAPSASPREPGARARQTRRRRSQHGASTAPMRSRPAPRAGPACSQAAAVASRAASHAGRTPRQAAGAHPRGVSRGTRETTARIVSRPTPRVSPQGESVAPTRRGNHCRPAAVSQNHEAGGRVRRAMAWGRRGPRLLDRPVCCVRRRTLWVAFAQRRLQSCRLVSPNPMSVGSLQEDCTRGGRQSHSVPDRHALVPP